MVFTQLACALAFAVALAPPAEPPSDPPAANELQPEPEPEPEPYRTEVVVGRERGGNGLAAQSLLSRRNVGFVTAIDVTQLRGEAADNLAGVVSRAPGVTVRSLGGLGQFGALSIRGSTSLQVPVFLDGAPLSGSMSGLVDLSSQPLDALARVELYRGYVPIRYGAAAIGGAMDLIGEVHHGPPRLWAAAGFGSYLAREARLGFATNLGPGIARGLSIAGRVGYSGSRGDFLYFDDGGTPRLAGDDGLRRRVNNDYDRTYAQVRVDYRRGAVRVAHHDSLWFKRQGIPGTAAAPSPDSSQRSVAARSVTRVRVPLGDDPSRPGHVEWVGSAAIQDRVFRDLGGQVGLAADDEHARSLDAWLSPRVRVPLWSMAWLELVAELRGEWIDIDERVGQGDSGPGPDPDPGSETSLASGDATRTRVSLATGAELSQWLFARRWMLAAGVRADLFASQFAVPVGAGEVDDGGRDSVSVGVSPRAGTKITIWQRDGGSLDLRGSVGRYLRAPNLGELFGDRGYMVGNEALRPEQGTKIDGGLVLDLTRARAGPEQAELAVFAQVAGFVTYSQDLIQWVRSGPVVQPVNVSGARVRGLEAGLSVRALGTAPLHDLTLDLAYTLLDSRNHSPEAEQQGKPLPGRPRHALLLRPSAGHVFRVGARRVDLRPRVFYELEWIAGTTLDLSGRVELPPRFLHGAGLALDVDVVEFTVEGRNLGNRLSTIIDPQFGPPTPYPAAIGDFIGFPLPGLSVWATVRIDWSF